MMKWIVASEQLPEIPDGRDSIEVFAYNEDTGMFDIGDWWGSVKGFEEHIMVVETVLDDWFPATHWVIPEKPEAA